MWELLLTNSHSLLNNIGYFTNPINEPISNPISISSNISTSNNKMFTRGWNCFETEITYDPNTLNKRISLSIKPFNKNVSEIVLEGAYNSTSSGTIITSNSSNPLKKGIDALAKSAGGEAKKWIKEKIGLKDDASKLIKLGSSALTAVASGGTTAMVKYGVNLVFGSFIGRLNKSSTTTQKLEFKTNGSINITGTLSSNTSTNCTPISNLHVPNSLKSGYSFFSHYDNKNLGVWNLSTKPTIHFSDKVMYTHSIGYRAKYERYIYFDKYQLKNNVKINNDILVHLDKYEISSEIIYYERFNKGYLGHSNLSCSLGYPSITGTIIYEEKDKNNIIVNRFLRNPRIIYSDPNTNYNPQRYYDCTGFKKNYVVKVTVTLYPKASSFNPEPIVSTRTYIPNYEIFPIPVGPPNRR